MSHVEREALQIQVDPQEPRQPLRTIKEGVKDPAVTHQGKARHLIKIRMGKTSRGMTITTTSTTRAKEHIRSSKSLVATTKKAANKLTKKLYHHNFWVISNITLNLTIDGDRVVIPVW